LYIPASVPRVRGGAISIKNNGAAVEAIVEKKESRNLPPVKIGIVLAVLVTIVPSFIRPV
jgi:hypothetical protein